MGRTHKFWASVAAICGLVLLGGCVAITSEVQVDARGGGSVDVQIRIPAPICEELRRLRSAGHDMDIPDLVALDKGALEMRTRGLGVKALEFTTSVVDEHEIFRISYEFDDLRAFSLGGAAIWTNEGDDRCDGLGLKRDGDGNIVLMAKQYELPESLKRPMHDEGGESEGKSDDLQDLMGLIRIASRYGNEFAYVYRVTVPGEILATNATSFHGRHAEWTLGKTENMQANTKRVAEMLSRLEVVFSGAGLDELKAGR